MKSLDELRDEIKILADNHIDTDELVRIANAVEREVEECYFELPKDADGEYIHIGDELDRGKVFRIEITDGGDHKAYVQTSQSNPQLEWYYCKYAHHKQPTVKDVLEEFASKRIRLFLTAPIATSANDIEECRKVNDEACEKLTAEFAERLQLREED